MEQRVNGVRFPPMKIWAAVYFDFMHMKAALPSQGWTGSMATESLCVGPSQRSVSPPDGGADRTGHPRRPSGDILVAWVPGDPNRDWG
ncbi:unnamed protein product [Boreogadus saida]